MDKPHKKLDVWQTSMKTTRLVYRLTAGFPEEEKFGLISQMRRSAVSIPCNIAEGAGRQGKREFRNFLSVAQGSLSELDTQLELAMLLGYCKRGEVEETVTQLLRIDKMLTGLIRSLDRENESTGPKRGRSGV
jgi:four helix bundle protein